MNRRVWAGWLLAGAFGLAAGAQTPLLDPPDLTAEQIIEKNAEARGGLDAWHRIQSIAWAGYVESASTPGRKMPFQLAQKRPNRTRFELAADSQKSIRAFDGSEGWKQRATGPGVPEVQAFTPDELKFARDAQGIEGPLMDFSDQGAAITLAGIDAVDGKKAYALLIKMPSGANHRVWVDAESFLEVRFDREFRNMAGQKTVTSVRFGNYGIVEGLQLPLLIETTASADKPADKLVIDRVALNPQLEDRVFAKPSALTARRKGVVVDTRGLLTSSSPRPTP